MERTLKTVHGSLTVTVPSDLTRTLGWRKGDRLRFEPDGTGARVSRVMPATPSLMTVGYEGKDAASFVHGLKQDGVKVLVDVRDLPLSRKKGFSKTALSEVLVAHGIRYEHLKPLGAPKLVRDPFKQSGYQDREGFRSSYLKHLGAQDDALSRLKEIARESATAIMCFEADHSMCHRSMVADAVAPDGFRIIHA